MKNVIVIILASALLLPACGSKKNSQSSKTSNGKKTEKVSAKESFPFIEAFHSGMRLKIKGDLDGAINAFQKCLIIKDTDDAVYYALGQIYMEKGDRSQAVQMMTKAHQLDPKNIWYTENIAILHYDAKQFDKAVPFFKKLVDYEPRNLSWLYGYGDCLLRIGKIDESIAVINKAEEVMGKNPSLSLEKYNMYMSIKKEKEALNELTKILEVYPLEPQVIATLVDHYFNKKEYEKGINYLVKLVEADPMNGRARLALGDIYRQQGKPKQAMEQFKHGFASADVDLDTKMKVMIGLLETDLGRRPETEELIEMMVLAHPGDAKPYSVQGDYFMSVEMDEIKALESYRMALQYDKSQFPIWNQVLILEYQNGLWNELYQDSKECLSYFTTQPIIYLMNGVSGIKVGKIDQAIESLTLGKGMLINDFRMEAEFLGQLGDAYFLRGDKKKGKEFYKEAIQLDTESNLLKNNFAVRLANAKEELELALSLINQAVTRSTQQANYYDTRGKVYFAMGKYSESLSDFTVAYEMDKSNATFMEHMGDAYVKLKQVDKALEYWQKALKISPNNTLLKKKIETKSYHESLD